MWSNPVKVLKWAAITLLGGFAGMLAIAFTIGWWYQEPLADEIPPETARRLLPIADWLQGEKHGVDPSDVNPAMRSPTTAGGRTSARE